MAKVRCPACNGTKEYLMSGDAHRSEGMVPCRKCDKDGYLEVEEPSIPIKKTPQEIYEEKYIKWLLTP